MKKALVFLFLCGLVLNSLFSDSHERPNIVYIMSDELAYFEVSYMGSEKLKTPRIDRLAKEGIRFDRFYAASPVLRSAPLQSHDRQTRWPCFSEETMGEHRLGQMKLRWLRRSRIGAMRRAALVNGELVDVDQRGFLRNTDSMCSMDTTIRYMPTHFIRRI